MYSTDASATASFVSLIRTLCLHQHIQTSYMEAGDSVYHIHASADLPVQLRGLQKGELDRQRSPPDCRPDESGLLSPITAV